VSQATGKPAGKKRLDDGIRMRDADVGCLHGPAADAVVGVFRAVDGRGVIPASWMSVRTLAILAGPADEGAGKNQDRQKGHQEHSHHVWPKSVINTPF
jgi:hypothetical protein